MEYVLIGKIATTFGLKGEVKVDVYTDFGDERFKVGSLVYLEVKDQYVALEIKTKRYHANRLLISFKGLEDLGSVEPYKGLKLYKDKASIKPLREGEYYFSDLEGLDVFLNGKLVAKVKRVEEGPGYNYLRVISKDQKEVLIPFIKDVFIESVDLQNKLINIKYWEGLL